ncbi:MULTISPECIES: hypothetical protein [unclassified Bradyrhizobium]|uniref:hypothetical protein n=1 Tax=unclassified Bradyrhizobium TaxID=2631580 RepID=UPI0028EFB0E2|nr:MULTISPECIES: hypothetical protein [unclassified Bradyrhizobium]
MCSLISFIASLLCGKSRGAMRGHRNRAVRRLLVKDASFNRLSYPTFPTPAARTHQLILLQMILLKLIAIHLSLATRLARYAGRREQQLPITRINGDGSFTPWGDARRRA